ncbi:MAG: AsmA family protein [Pseudomonadota bacterium]
MAKFLWRVIVYLSIAITGIGIVLFQNNVQFRVDPQTMADRASDLIGRKVTVGDDANLTFFPVLGVNVTAFTIDNAEGMTADHLLSADRAVIGFKILPLLTGNVEVSKFVITRPMINFERRRDGVVNWSLETREGQAGESENTGGGSFDVSNRVRDLRLGDVRVIDGTLTYLDGILGEETTLSSLDMTLALPSLSETTSLAGDFIYNTEEVTIDARISTLAALRAGDRAAAQVRLRFLDAALSVDGEIASDPALTYGGLLEADVPSVRQIAQWLERPIAVQNGFEQLSVKGDVTGDLGMIAIRNAKLQFDDIVGGGRLGATWDRDRPLLSGDLTLDRLDLRPYSPSQSETDSTGFPPWSATAINFTPLSIVDMDFDVSTRKLLVQRFEIDDTALSMTLTNGTLDATLKQMRLYDGTGSGTLKLETNRRRPRLAATFALKDMAAVRFLRDAARLDRLEGDGDLTFAVTARGRSQKDFVSTLKGDGAFTVRDGSLVGFDFLKFAYQIGIFVTGQYQRDYEGEDRTAFTAFESTFTVNRGVIATDDITMLSPLFRLTGEGTVSLPPQSQDIRLNPRLVASLRGQGGDRDRRGLGVPIRISGTFNDPKVGLDVGQAARKRVEDEARKRFDDSIDLPGGEEGGASPTDALEGILGRRKRN